MRIGMVFLIAVICLTGGQAGQGPSRTSEPHQPENWSLAQGVVETLKEANRGGSLIYRGKCLADSQISESYTLKPPLTTKPMDYVLNDIVKHEPMIRWIDYGGNDVRISDISAKAAVLNVRVNEFHLQDVVSPDLAISRMWETPEVKTFAALNRIHLVGFSLGAVPAEGQYTKISIDLHDATVAEIMDKITQRYRRVSGSSTKSVWVYHECERRGETLVELQVRY
jgi:hypothetical protein